jgi:hypothetical protein
MPHNAGDAAKAYRLRKKKDQLGPIDRLWLADYDEKQEKEKAARSKNRGRSASARTVEFKMEEASASEGEGNAAAVAAGALVAREEGRRLDALTMNALDGYKQLVADQRAFIMEIRRNERVAQLRVANYEATHVAMLNGVRDHFAARTEAEIALMHEQEQPTEGDPAKDLLLMMIAKKLGIPMQEYLPAPPGQHPFKRRRPPPNGAPKRS